MKNLTSIGNILISLGIVNTIWAN